MERDDIKIVLKHIKKALTLNVTLYDDTVSVYYAALKRYTPKVVNEVVMDICIKWDKRYIPPAVMISDLCRVKSGSTQQEVEYTPPENHPDHLKDHYYKGLVARFNSEWLFFKRQIIEGGELSDKFKRAKVIADRYIENMWPEFDIKRRFTLPNPSSCKDTGFRLSYAGLFCEALAGKLPELTRRKGNLYKP